MSLSRLTLIGERIFAEVLLLSRRSPRDAESSSRDAESSSRDAEPSSRRKAMAAMTPAWGRVRVAFGRQAQQSVAGLGLALLGVSAFAPVAALVRFLVARAEALHVPLGEPTVLASIITIFLVAIEEMVGMMIRGHPRLWVVAKVMVMQIAMMVAGVTITKARGMSNNSTANLFMCMVTFVLSKPLVIFFTAGQGCRARLRRTIRELKAGFNRLSAMGPGLTVVLYVNLTVFKSMTPLEEVMVMGLAMPMLQCVCMSLLAWVIARQERITQRALARKLAVIAAAAAAQDSTCVIKRKDDDAALRNNVEKSGPQLAGQSQVSLVMVMSAQIVYSTSAFATLALAESTQTFLLSLVFMLAVQVLEVAVHVKARRAVSRVVDETTAEALLGDDACIRDWLRNQELGEKLGVALALGFLAVDKAFGRDVPAVEAVDMRRLAIRGAAMVLLELVGDVGKDLMSQAMGVVPAQAGQERRLSLPPLVVGIAVSVCITAALLVQGGFALGT